MAKKRKRQADGGTPQARRLAPPPSKDPPMKRDLFQQLYSNVTPLKTYVLSVLPASSRLRRKKVASLTYKPEEPNTAESELARLLDTTIVCSHNAQIQDQDFKVSRWEAWRSFSQKGEDSRVSLSGGESALYSQSEIVDFVIWTLFSKEKNASQRPKHLLCDGYRRTAGEADQAKSSIPDLFSLYPNANVKMLRQKPWPQLLQLLGQSGERLMIDLLVDCSLFLSVESGFQNYYQLCGVPISELKADEKGPVRLGQTQEARRLSDITLVRSRMFYAKPALNAAGIFQAGFKHIHALNRYPHRQSREPTPNPENTNAVQASPSPGRLDTLKLMMYIFPRQFGLHNAFTSSVDATKTVQKFQDYTSRDDEIAQLVEKSARQKRTPKTPNRLRGRPRELVERLQVLRSRCSYFELLRHYCPTVLDECDRTREAPKMRRQTTRLKAFNMPSTGTAKPRKRGRKLQTKSCVKSQPSAPSLGSGPITDLASPAAHVSAFCQAVLSKIIPRPFWGEGDGQKANLLAFRRKIDHFIRLRRFESMSLHEISQDIKLADVTWLHPADMDSQKPSQTDTLKRLEMLHEFLYYVFDSLLIPLIRSNFYVTESNTHRYQVFYFRHDVWRLLAEPHTTVLRDTMFEEIRQDQALRTLQQRRFGFSQVRLLPKGKKLRPIMNLRKRAIAQGSKSLQFSINTVLGPVHTLLNYEKHVNPSMLGSSMFSVSEIYDRLKAYKKRTGESKGRRFYFAKLDVQAAFDTIPQEAVLQRMMQVPGQTGYSIRKHAEVRAGERAELDLEVAQGKPTKPLRRWHANAMPDGSATALLDRLVDQVAAKKKKTVFVDNALQRNYHTSALLGLLTQHVQQNIVRIGKRYYRQKRGIPQGSIVSSYLCNYFYADLERRHLGFLGDPDCLLLRLVDDFLLITLDKSKAVRFIETMHDGLPEYGVIVNREKTLVNFHMERSSGITRRLSQGDLFPYCGTLVDCQTLEISKDRNREPGVSVRNSLTVDFGRNPGVNFARKVLNAFKIQSHLMFYDTTHNSAARVLDSLRDALCETATKMCAYLRLLPRDKRPSNSFIMRLVVKVADVAFLLLTGKSRRLKYEQYACDIRKAQVTSLTFASFLAVLQKKQSSFRQIVTWLQERVNNG